MEKIIKLIQITVIVLCIYLVYLISHATLSNITFTESTKELKIQFWICIYFIIAFIAEFFLSGDKKWKYLRNNFLFLLVSIPYISIINRFNINIGDSKIVTTFLKYIPLIRGGYALSIAVKWFSSNKISSLLITYLVILLSGVYFGALLFYEIEFGINPMLKNFWDASWWSMMNATTVGSNIYAITIPGQILSTLIAATGMMMFPIFTIYITNIVTKFGKNNSKNIDN